ncbi:MFS transporter [Amycolatopsis rubida]|uniref:Drug resistance transporter, EmrB/QacA subfamily n=1 Tax=Amycolatopsis rubida TaxID=112413 RepID=A0A1I5TI11_9PSEU|nr:MFS transporter [Amycolatopsis rubida]SFP82712.1 drug resistance transporter, EmrB/QacA subfamily [Amycolatopsis rubida]
MDASSISSNTSRRPWLALAVVLFATFMDILDTHIVSVAIPRIQEDLNGSYAAGQWCIAGYALSFALVLVIGGRLGDMFGRKRIFLVGVTGFAACSLLCVLAPSMGVLIGARVMQGAFAGLMAPQVLAVIQVLFPPERRKVAFVAFGVTLNLAQVSAPILGGVLATYDLAGLHWRAIFLINIPLGLLTVLGALLYVPESRSDQRMRFDLVGMVLIALVSAFLMYPLQQGRELGWPVWMLVMLVVAIPLAAVFARYERRRSEDAALVPASLVRRRSFAAGTLVYLVLFSGTISAFLIVIWNVQFALGWSPIRTAITMLGWVTGILVTAPLAVKFGDNHGRTLVGTGCGLLTVGTVVMSSVVRVQADQLTSPQLFGCFVLMGTGMGLLSPILISLVLAEVPPRDAGAASGITNAVMQFGAAAGVGVVGLIFFSLVARGADAESGRVAPGLRAELASTDLAPSTSDQIVADFRRCFGDRAGAVNPDVVPGSCRAASLQEPAARRAVEPFERSATTRNWADATANTLWYQVFVFLVALVFTRALPKGTAG